MPAASEVRDTGFHAPGLSSPFDCGGCTPGPATLFARPHDLRLSAGNGHGLKAKVEAVHRLAGRITVDATLVGQARPLLIDIAGDDLPYVPERGQSVGLEVRRYKVFPTPP